VECDYSVIKAIISELYLPHGHETNYDNTEVIPPQELPECDVMEFDCEGAELEIINDMQSEPRLLIIEVEARGYDEDNPLKIFDVIESKGYKIKRCTGHNGCPISTTKAKSMIKKCYEQNQHVLVDPESGEESLANSNTSSKRKELESVERPMTPIIVTAERNKI